jgi:hypothetical protein
MQQYSRGGAWEAWLSSKEVLQRNARPTDDGMMAGETIVNEQAAPLPMGKAPCSYPWPAATSPPQIQLGSSHRRRSGAACTCTSALPETVPRRHRAMVRVMSSSPDHWAADGWEPFGNPTPIGRDQIHSMHCPILWREAHYGNCAVFAHFVNRHPRKEVPGKPRRRS